MDCTIDCEVEECNQDQFELELPPQLLDAGNSYTIMMSFENTNHKGIEGNSDRKLNIIDKPLPKVVISSEGASVMNPTARRTIRAEIEEEDE